MNRFHQKAFTLVELAVVVVIVGLLIGGLIKGQELVANSRLAGTMAQAKLFHAATTQFSNMYGHLPGDFPDAAFKLRGCNSNCANAADGISDGNGFIGDRTTPRIWKIYSANDAVFHSPVNTPGDEKFLFWTHLLKAGLISGVTDQGLYRTTRAEISVTHPKSKMGGAFLAGTQKGGDCRRLGWPASCADTDPLPHFTGLALAPNVERDASDITTASDELALTPVQAAQIDRKMDDGFPLTGMVRGFGNKDTCFRETGNTTTYVETTITKDCGLFFILKN